MAKILIQNNCGGIVQVQLPAPGGSKVNLEDRTVTLGHVIDLAPGVTSVDKGAWENAKKNPTIAKMLREVVPPSPAPEQDQRLVGRVKIVELSEVADENPLAKMKAPEALKVIEETLDTNTLGDWLKTEGRAELRKAIQKQMDEINAPYLGKGGAMPPTGGEVQT